LVASHTWEIVQKLVEGVTPLEIVVEGLDRYPGPDKDGGPAENPWVAVNNRLLGHGLVACISDA